MLSSSSVPLPSEVSDTNLTPFIVLPKTEPVVWVHFSTQTAFRKFRLHWKAKKIKNRGVAQLDPV